MGDDLRGKRILLVSPEPWGHIAVSKHHYARALAEQGNEVFFLGPPERGYEIQATWSDRLWVLKYPGFPKGMRFFPRSYQRKRTRKEFERLEKLAGTDFDILWSFDNSVFFEMSAIPSSVLKILHVVDLDQDFQLERAVHTADICFCTTPFIRSRIEALGKNAAIVGHGYFQPPAPSSPAELPGSAPLKALFSGNLRRTYLDWDLLYEVASDHSRVDLLLMGPNAESIDLEDNPTEGSKRRLFDFPNVHFLAPVPAEELPAYLMGADILLAPYREGFQDQMANPHKIMEYMGSGRPILATYMACYSEYAAPLICMVRRNEEFSKFFADMVEHMEAYEEDRWIRERKAIAEASSYDKRIREIEGLLADIEARS